ncbi:hypothetical protein PENSPDRAFT_298247 [Peniophora sp. CONT]|nr:hypothetical protein PENSPDRAFT_298247 [Peniophora sp. CONT]
MKLKRGIYARAESLEMGRKLYTRRSQSHLLISLACLSPWCALPLLLPPTSLPRQLCRNLVIRVTVVHKCAAYGICVVRGDQTRCSRLKR